MFAKLEKLEAFSDGIPIILHGMKQSYYKALVTLDAGPALSRVISLVDDAAVPTSILDATLADAAGLDCVELSCIRAQCSGDHYCKEHARPGLMQDN